MRSVFARFVSIAALAVPATTAAEDRAGAADEQAAQALEALVVVGTRSAPRSVQDSPVPVDVIQGEEFALQSDSDLSNLIRAVVPSFNVNTNPTRDQAALLRPVSLRGLAADHTLVLMNGKRRHRGSVIQWAAVGASNGAQGPDISALPGIAIQQLEVLRDGAAAQYGSDAIAGVVNFILKEAREGFAVEAKYGQYAADSGEDLYTVAGNLGLPIADRGFANLSFEYAESSPTDRSVQHQHALELIDVGIANVAVPAKPWGRADVEDSLKLVVNTGLDIDDDARLYGFGNYARRDVETPFFYRSPMNRNALYKTVDDNILFGGEGCAEKYGAVAATAANIPVYRDRLRQDAACFAFIELYPQGFTPRLSAKITDYSLAGGVRGVMANGLLYDLSASLGRNATASVLGNTLNASLGPDSPRDFYIGEYAQTESNVNLDLSYPVDVGLASPLNVATGLEWRQEEFEIETGEPASWKIGPYQRYGFGSGSNGFPGFNPASAGSWSRGNIAAYLDLEADMTASWRLGGALRWEDFDDFGTTANFKLSTLLQVSEFFALRSSYGTGFRAPTPGQANARNLATSVTDQGFEERGTIGSTHPVATALGGRPLEPEESTNLTLGTAFELGNGLRLTVDYFRIDVEDRIALSGLFDVTDAIKRQLIASGIPGADEFNKVRFFTNDFDTLTQGIDLVLNYGFDSGLGRTDFLLSYNHTETDLESYRSGSPIVQGNYNDNLERGIPQTRYNVTATQRLRNWELLARYVYFGGWYDDHSNDDFNGYGMADLIAHYAFESGLSLAFGAENVFDEYPEKTINVLNGRKYPRFSPGGFNGRLFHARLSFEF